MGISGTDYDTVLTQLVSQISAFLENYLERKIEQASFTEYYDGDGEDLFIKNYPIASSPAMVISYNSGTQNTPVWNVINPENYSIYFEEGIIKYAFPTGERNIKVAYTGGYATVPADMELAAIQMIAKSFEQRKAQGKLQESLGGASITWKPDMTEEQKIIFDKYRRVII